MGGEGTGIVLEQGVLGLSFKVGDRLRKFSKLFGVIALVTVEMFFYFSSGQDDLEMFFMIWIFISAALILNNTFRRGDRPAMLGLGGNDSVKYAYLSSTFMESELSSGKKNKPSRLGGLFDLWNLIYLCFLMVNIIAYIVVMPK